MDLVTHFGAMATNNAWSNARLHGASARLSHDAFVAERTGFFPSLQLTLNHLLIVDRAYLDDLEGSGRALGGGEILFERADDLAAAQRQTDVRLIAFCRALEPHHLGRIVPIDRGDGVPYRDTVAAILSHLFVHQIHHRGQAHAMLSATLVAPPQLDEFFLASDEPARNDELLRLGLTA